MNFRRHMQVRLEVCAHFRKQTYRNRCLILTANGVLSLSIPVRFGNRTPTSDVTIDYAQSWAKDHERAIRSAYGKAPFYDFYADMFFGIIRRKWDTLVELDVAILTKCLEILELDCQVSMTKTFQSSYDSAILDLRDQIHPKKETIAGKFYRPHRYIQTFGNKFVPNLSVLDLIMCEGPAASSVVRMSDPDTAEQK